jgi:hypothetical protein
VEGRRVSAGREFLAVIMAGLLLWPGAMPLGAQDRSSQSPQPVRPPNTPPDVTIAPPAKPKEPAKPEEPEEPEKTPGRAAVKPIPSCGFCLEDGTKVPLLLGRELVSSKEVTGNRVDFEVAEEIRVEDVVVIPKGSRAFGTIVEAQGRRHLGRAGKLNVKIEEVRLADGERVRLRAIEQTSGQGRQGVMTVGIVATGVLFFPVAPLFLFMRGKDVVIAQGAPVTAYVEGNNELEKGNFEQVLKGSMASPQN